MNFNVYAFDPLADQFTRLAGGCDVHDTLCSAKCDCVVVNVCLQNDLCSGTELFSNKPAGELSVCDFRKEPSDGGRATTQQVATEAARRGLIDSAYRRHLLNLLRSQLCATVPGFLASTLTELDPELNTPGTWDRLVRVLVRLLKDDRKEKVVLSSDDRKRGRTPEPGDAASPQKKATKNDSDGSCKTAHEMPVCFVPSGYSTMGWFEVFLRKDTVSFHDIVDFCENPRSKVVLPGVPPRSEWTLHTPIMLMNDYNGKYSYVVTDATELSSVRPVARFQLNEVFLKNRPVNRLNIDVDAKVCDTCLRDDELRTAKMLAWATEFLTCVKKVYVDHGAGANLELEDCGKLRVYVRNNKKKYSGRLLWYPPVGLTFNSVVEASRFLTTVLKTATLKNQLKQYLVIDDCKRPVSFTCARCTTVVQIKHEQSDPAVSNLAADDPVAGGPATDGKRIKQFVIDTAPYSVHKSIRLPNAYKDKEPFKYTETINDHYAGDTEDFCSMAVGLSSLPPPPDTQKLTLGKGKPLPWTVLETRVQVKPMTYDGSKNDYYEAHFAKLWGVPVTLQVSSGGLNIIQATEHTDLFACPDHKRVHTKNFPRVIILSENSVRYKCFKN